MDSSFCFDKIVLVWSLVYIEAAKVQIKFYFFLLMVFVLENSVDPVEMPHYAESLYCISIEGIF